MQKRIAVTSEFARALPVDFFRKQMARETGDLLTEAMLTGSVDTTMPIYIDGAQRSDAEFAKMDLHEVKLSLDYFPREASRQQLEAARRAIEKGRPAVG